MPELWTIGHSTHALDDFVAQLDLVPLDDFVALLERHDIELLADVRTVPKSRRHPHFRTEALAAELPARGVDYRHLKGLGGWRKAAPDSPNGAWENVSFRGYADYALTDEFAAAFAELGELVDAQRVAIMCSEAVWWRCHRRLVADRAVAHGWTVHHIGADGRTSDHRLADFAVVEPDGRVLYPAT